MTASRTPFRLDYWLPDPKLEGLVSGYHHYTVDPGQGRRHHDVFFPGCANIRVQVDGAPSDLLTAEEYATLTAGENA